MNETFRYEKNSEKAVALSFSRKADHLHFYNFTPMTLSH